jgi:transposase InsO family protein
MRCGEAPPRPQRRLDKIGACKAERFIRTLLDEWAYLRPYRSNAERLAALPRYLGFYNRRRPHTAIRGLVPAAAVNNVLKHHT